MQNATPKQMAEIARMLAEGECGHDTAQALIEHRVQVLQRPLVPPVPGHWQLHEPRLQVARLKQFLAFSDREDRYVESLARRWDGKVAGTNGLGVIPMSELAWTQASGDWPPMNRALASLVECSAPRTRARPKDCAVLSPRQHYSYKPDCLTLRDRTVACYARLRQGTPGDFYVLPIQIVPQGSDTEFWFDPTKVPLCPFAVGALLTANWDQLPAPKGEWVTFYCPGGQAEERAVYPQWVADGGRYWWQHVERGIWTCRGEHRGPGCCEAKRVYKEWAVWGVLPAEFLAG